MNRRSFLFTASAALLAGPALARDKHRDPVDKGPYKNDKQELKAYEKMDKKRQRASRLTGVEITNPRAMAIPEGETPKARRAIRDWFRSWVEYDTRSRIPRP